MILLLGFLSQGLFGIRLLVQLWYTEKNRTNSAPVLYWLFSLWAALLFLLYGILRQDVVIVVGQLITYLIYIRNIQLQGKWSGYAQIWKVLSIVLPLTMLIYFVFYTDFQFFSMTGNAITLIGFVGQLFMNARFVLQWIYAERIGSSAFPIFFWYISIIGSFMLLIYGCWHPIHGFDPVIILAQLMGITVYVRSAYLQLKM
ncbi:MAG: lipid-A-disaccharide synthase N-terminal domain-containing protein [Cyclobacteriaceae bacterium]